MINFYTDQVSTPDIDNIKISLWIEKIILKHGKLCGEINYIFCNDQKILEVNKEYLNHDYYTDIITFDYSENSILSGDIYISIDTVFSNSKQFNSSYNEELARVIIHGILHLCNYKDKTEEESLNMRKLENESLEILNTL